MCPVMSSVASTKIGQVFLQSSLWYLNTKTAAAKGLCINCITKARQSMVANGRFWIKKFSSSPYHQSGFCLAFPHTGGVIGSGISLGFLGFYEPNDEKKIEETIVMHIKKSILYMQREEYDAAERELLQGFHLSRQHGFAEALTQITSYQANLALRRGKLDRAEECFKFLAQRLINLKQATTTDNTFIEVSLKLAEIYAKTGRFDEAMSGYQYCVIAQKQKIEAGADDEDTLVLGAWALHSLSQLYLSLGSPGATDDIHYAKAIFCLKKAEGYLSKALGPDAQQSISIKSDLATALALKGDHVAAFKIFGEISEIAKEKYTELYAGIRVNVGNIHLQKSEFDIADKVCSEAKNLATQFKDMEAFQRAEDCLVKSVQGKKALQQLRSQSQPA